MDVYDFLTPSLNGQMDGRECALCHDAGSIIQNVSGTISLFWDNECMNSANRFLRNNPLVLAGIPDNGEGTEEPKVRSTID